MQIRYGESKGGQVGQDTWWLRFFVTGNGNQNQDLGTEYLVRRRIINVKVKLALQQAIEAKRGREV